MLGDLLKSLFALFKKSVLDGPSNLGARRSLDFKSGDVAVTLKIVDYVIGGALYVPSIPLSFSCCKSL